MNKIWINRASSFKEAESFDYHYYMKMPRAKRLEIMQFLRKTYKKIGGDRFDVSSERLRRVIKIIQ